MGELKSYKRSDGKILRVGDIISFVDSEWYYNGGRTYQDTGNMNSWKYEHSNRKIKNFKTINNITFAIIELAAHEIHYCGEDADKVKIITQCNTYNKRKVIITTE